MISNRVKKSVWLMLIVINALCAFYWAFQKAIGNAGWGNFIDCILLGALSFKFYLAYRDAVKGGNLFGRVNIFSRRRNG